MSGLPFGSASPYMSGGASGASDLCNLPLEKLNARLTVNLNNRMNMMDKREMMREGGEDAEMDEDPEMLDANIAMLAKRIKDIKAAIAARTASSSAGSPAMAGPSSSGSNAPLRPQLLYTPEPSDTSSRRADGPSLNRMSSSSHLASDDPPDLPRIPRPTQATIRKPPSTTIPNQSDFDRDIEMAEAMDNAAHMRRPTSPSPRTQGSSRRRQALQDEIHAAAMAEMEDLPIDDIFSSPTALPPSRPIRHEASTARSMMGGPGPSTQQAQQARAQAIHEAPPAPVQMLKKHSWTKEIDKKLREIFKLPGFRHHQREAVDATMGGRDVFVLMPTGGGKSLTYQLPAICSDGVTKGVTFVISPLISLINDQSRHLCNLNIPAIAYTGDLSQADKNLAHEQLSKREPHTKVVYVTPEMMSMGGTIKHIMRDLYNRQRLARFVIDEAHCVSQWGHDVSLGDILDGINTDTMPSSFDPIVSYICQAAIKKADQIDLKLGSLRKDYPGVPIMALTATAQDKVQDDIIRSLGIQGCEKLKQSFNRPNLNYEVRPKKKELLKEIVGFIGTQERGASGIIYCSSRDKCEEVAMQLKQTYNIRARHYHAGMPKNDRRAAQEDWQDHKFEIIVATVAFGMGIDKADVRFVIHYSLPRSLEGYYQETGRAGRDGKNSDCVLYYTFGDSASMLRMIESDRDMTKEQKDRQKASLHEVLRYCENKTDCRRSQVLSFFSETFDPAKCNGGCDVCLHKNKNNYTSEDVTEDAILMIKMVQAFDKSDRITRKNAADCFRGMNGKSAKGLSSNEYFGSGKTWGVGEAERLVAALLISCGLDEFNVQNGAGYSNSYLRLGKNYKAIIAGRQKIMMDFREASPRKEAAKTSKKRISAGADETQGQIKFTAKKSNPVSRQRSIQQIQKETEDFDNSHWGDSDEDAEYAPDDPIEVDGDATDVEEDVPLKDAKRRRTTSGPSTAGPSKSAPAARQVVDLASASDLDRGNTMSPVDWAYKQLKEMYTKKRAESKTWPMMDDGMLQEIAARLPKNEKALADIEGLSAAHRKKFGSLILGITVKSLERGNSVQKRRETVSALQDLRYVPSRSTSAASNRPAPTFTTSANTKPITSHASSLKEPRTNLGTLSAIAQGAPGRLAQRSGTAGGGSGIKLAKPQTVKSKF